MSESPAPVPRLGRGRTPATPAAQGEREALYRAHLLDSAEPLFADRGFDETRMQDIALAAGVSLSKLYAVYDSKQTLYTALLSRRNHDFMQWIAGSGITRVRAIEDLLKVSARSLGYLLAHRDFLRLQLREGHAWHHPAAQRTGKEQRAWSASLAFMQDVIAWGMRKRLFVPCDARHQAHMIVSLQQIRLESWVRDGMKGDAAELVEQIQCDLLRLLCRPEVAAGLLKPQGHRLGDALRAALERGNS